MGLGVWMESEIGEQPALLARNAGSYADQLRPLKNADLGLVVLAARGSSDHAALYLRYLLEVHLGIPVSLAAPSVITRFGASLNYPRPCLVVGISQSGAAPDVAEVLAAARADGHLTLGITNTAGSRLAKVAEHALLLGSGEERSIAATKTYTASLLAAYQLTRTLGANLPEPELPTEAWLETCSLEAAKASGIFVRSNPLFSLGRGYDYATAHETALKLMECALLGCKAYSVADFEHGPKALAGAGSAAVVFGTPSSDLGGEMVVAPSAPVSPELAPLWQACFGQYLALFAARARGLDPDHAQRLRKVTETL